MATRALQTYGICAALLVISITVIALTVWESGEITTLAVFEAPPPEPVERGPEVLQATPEPTVSLPGNTAPVQAPIDIQELTIADAENAIWEGERIMADLHREGIAVQFINDTLIEARRVLQKANYTIRLAEAQTSGDAETAVLLQQSLALMSATYSGATVQESYAEVIRLVNLIRERRDPAYLVLDRTALIKRKIAEYAKRDIPTDHAARLLAEGERAFRDERYSEAMRYVEEADAELERSRTELPLVRVLQESSKGFLEKNWKQLLVLLAFFTLGMWFWARRFGIAQIKRRMERLQIELESIGRLMEQTQRDCFERKSISKMTYDLRMETYRKRRAEIQVLLPTLQEELRQITKQPVAKERDVLKDFASHGGVLRVERSKADERAPQPATQKLRRKP